jgi:AcrR family transcriptional regulator
VRGRPRSQRARSAILDAARALFEEGGYPATTIEAIALRSGVAKTTIYRWWPNRATLVVELLLQLSVELAPLPVGKDPLRALRGELDRVAESGATILGRLLLSLLGEAQRDPAVRDALQQGLFQPRRRASAEAVRQAQVAGAMRKDVPPLVAVDLLFGPVFFRRYVRLEPASRKFVRQVFEHALAGLGPAPRNGRRRRRASAGSRRRSAGA